MTFVSSIHSAFVRVTGFCTLFLFFTAFLPTTSLAQFSGGDGSDENPFQITDINQLTSINDFRDKSFILMNDLKGDNNVLEAIESFNGKFNGNGFSISDFTFSTSFVGSISNSEISNLVFENVIFGERFTGGIGNSTIHNISFENVQVNRLNRSFLGAVSSSTINNIQGHIKIINRMRLPAFGATASYSGGFFGTSNLNYVSKIKIRIDYEIIANNDYFSTLANRSRSSKYEDIDISGNISSFEVFGLFRTSDGDTLRRVNTNVRIHSFQRASGLIGAVSSNETIFSGVVFSGEIKNGRENSVATGVALNNVLKMKNIQMSGVVENNNGSAHALAQTNSGSFENIFITSRSIGSNTNNSAILNQNTGQLSNIYFNSDSIQTANTIGFGINPNIRGFSTEQMTGRAALQNLAGLPFGEIWGLNAEGQVGLLAFTPYTVVQDVNLTSSVQLDGSQTLQFTLKNLGEVVASGCVDIVSADLNLSDQVCYEIDALGESLVTRTYALAGKEPGRYTISIEDVNQSVDASFSYALVPSAIALIAPTAALINVATQPTFSWNADPLADTYELQIAEDSSFSTGLLTSTTSDTSFTLGQPLVHLSTYFWRVRGLNTIGEGDWSAIRSFTTMIERPSTPSLSQPAANATNQPIELATVWRSSARAESYRFQLGRDVGFTNPEIDSVLSDTTFNLTNLDYNTRYFWRVRALNVGGESAWSRPSLFTTAFAYDRPLLAEPSNQAQNVTTTLRVFWQAVPNATDYDLEVSTSSSFASLHSKQALDAASMAKIADGETSSWQVAQQVDGLNYETTYYWRVRASGPLGLSDWSNVRNFRTKQEPVSGIVRPLSPSNGSQDVPIPSSLFWNALTDAESYEVQIAYVADFSSRVQIEGITATQVALSEHQITDSTTYYWRVRAINRTERSEWSDIWSFRTELRVPEVPEWQPANEQQIGGNEVLLVWAPSTRAASYGVQLSQSSDFTTVELQADGITEAQHRVSGLQNSATYFWRVQAVNEAGTSGWSNPRSFKTGVLTSLDESELPTTLTLYQNYPNPFNPVTQISYSLPEAGAVRLKVFNMAGQPIQTLVDRAQAAGQYQVSFDASALPTGIYLYRLENGEQVLTKKMLLVK